MAWMLGKKKAPLTSPLTQAIDGAIYKGLQPKVSAEQKSLEAKVAEGPAPSTLMPGEDQENVREAVRANAAAARKRRGRASTLLGGTYGAPDTTSETLMGSF